MSPTTPPPARSPESPARARAGARTVLAWCGAIAYPAVLYLTMQEAKNGVGILETVPAAALTVVVATLLPRRPLPVLALLLTGWTVALTAMPNPEVGYLEMLVTDLAVGLIAAVHPRRSSIIAAVLTLAAQLGAATLFTGAWPWEAGRPAAVLVLVAIAAAWTAGNSIRERRKHAEELASRAASQAVTAERLRIARELHDMVAHSIGIIAIQAGVGSRVIDTQPAEARAALSAIEATSRDTLSGLRRMLGALRRAEPGSAAPLDPAPGLADLDRLAAATMDAGVRVDLRWHGERRPLPPDIDLSAFRVVQEAVTNVVRHAGTRHCQVSIGFQDQELSVEVVDDGRGHTGHGGGPGTGYGLVGMRERIGLLNGRLAAGPRPEGGFRVEARLPVPAEAR
ncbi:sensor histidine kinase [Spirillospora sp. NBC_01491]|uniref:sensor histidine kinase n=1 Tax=Spirillospora sp. NBC_01491 TaxID=2976007 RepID=UPI002E378158|nr:histidine kinase [Spirillospora sp. NBC_01491]